MSKEVRERRLWKAAGAVAATACVATAGYFIYRGGVIPYLRGGARTTSTASPKSKRSASEATTDADDDQGHGAPSTTSSDAADLHAVVRPAAAEHTTPIPTAPTASTASMASTRSEDNSTTAASGASGMNPLATGAPAAASTTATATQPATALATTTTAVTTTTHFPPPARAAPPPAAPPVALAPDPHPLFEERNWILSRNRHTEMVGRAWLLDDVGEWLAPRAGRGRGQGSRGSGQGARGQGGGSAGSAAHAGGGGGAQRRRGGRRGKDDISSVMILRCDAGVGKTLFTRYVWHYIASTRFVLRVCGTLHLRGH